MTADPTDEWVENGGSCLYIATANDAESLAWHFVSPDGQVDVPYTDIAAYFPELGVEGGADEYLTISNIPAAFNGWGSYCVFSNKGATAASGTAYTYVAGAEEALASEQTQQNGAQTPDGDLFLGTFVEPTAGRGVMDITTDGDLYYVTVSWSNGAYENDEWTFSGYFDARGNMQYSNCLKVVTTFDEEGNATPQEVYNSGTGYIKIDDYGVTWSDDQGDVPDGTYFARQ